MPRGLLNTTSLHLSVDDRHIPTNLHCAFVFKGLISAEIIYVHMLTHTQKNNNELISKQPKPCLPAQTYFTRQINSDSKVK